MKYTKAQFEQIVLTQLENLNTQDEHINLIKKQNELLVKSAFVKLRRTQYNHKLIDELSDKVKEPKPYPIPKRRRK